MPTAARSRRFAAFVRGGFKSLLSFECENSRYLAWDCAFRRYANGFVDARGRHAPLLDAALFHLILQLASVGVGHPADFESGAALPFHQFLVVARVACSFYGIH